MQIKQGDILLLAYLYTDTQENKLRPVIVLSNQAAITSFFIVAKITSVIHQDRFSFPLHNSNLTFELNKPSEVRTNELNTVHKTTITRRIGELKPQAL
jgi:mRNA-degrading endonuclease toxin of MazEF toxin-antitoxin module